MIIGYDSKYDEQIKDLLVELQEYIVKIDKEGYNIIGEGFREKYYEKTMMEIKNNSGKILLFEENGEIVGLIAGIVDNDEVVDYDFKAPKRGKITELIVTKKCRGKKYGKELLDKMVEYLKNIECKKIMISVFGYNENAIKFYEKNGYHIRMIDMIED